MKKPLISIIIPTYNSYNNLRILFESLARSEDSRFEIVINDDKRSADKALELITEYRKQGLKIIYKKENISMAQGRKVGVSFSHADILLHMDSDMKVSKNLLGECIKLISNKYDALIIPEKSYGSSFWARCKSLEKKCYEGVEQLESLRCLKKDVYEAVGGHNEKMVFSEDKDLDIRVRKAGYTVGRTSNYIYHNEGNLSLLDTVRKKKTYSNTINTFAQVHPNEFRWQINILNRYKIFIHNWRFLIDDPFLFLGLFIMKTAEFLTSLWRYIF